MLIIITQLFFIKMKIACEEVVKYVLPAYRSMVANALVYEYGFTQQQTAKLMEISQAVVSYYITNKRGKGVSKYASVKLLKEYAERSAKKLATTGANDENFCEICMELRRQGVMSSTQGCAMSQSTV